MANKLPITNNFTKDAKIRQYYHDQKVQKSINALSHRRIKKYKMKMFFKVTSKKNSKTGLVYNEEDQEHILHSKGVQLQFFSLNSLLERDTSHSCYI